MPLRDLILHNFGWKLLSLMLAVAIWLYVDATMPKTGTVKRNPVSGKSSINFHQKFPVMVMTEGGDPHVYTVEPDGVEVTLTGDPETISAISEADVQVLADLSRAPRPLGRADVTNEFVISVQVRTSFTDVTASADPPAVRIRQLLSGRAAPKLSDSKSKP
ncbi:MAG: hypothetical protein HY301_18055 [Verrucomicrobia bacterium]|nr:hypothetical protein [Verrucomicrobiota bacterium]